MRRVLAPEFLDELPPGDPRAVGSRADLRRLNFLMGHAGAFLRSIRQHCDQTPFRTTPLWLLELGAGDGTLLLRVARRGAARRVAARVALLDRHDLVSAETRAAFSALGWLVESRATDVFTALEESFPVADVMLANLFLHHFSDKALAVLFRLVAARTNLFIACEPRRAPLALLACRCLRLIGCNAITRHDAVASVRAGFAGFELSALWPADVGWKTSERAAGGFSHCFVAKRSA
jgi:predicted nicotinamide N-methyase